MRVLMLLPSILLFAAACGGETKTTEPAGAPATSGSGSSAATAAATKAASSGAAATSGLLDACKLITPEDVARVTGLTGVSVATSAPGDPSFCIYGTAAGVQAASLTQTRANASKDFDALATGTEAVAGLGEKAHWNARGKTLTILKGGTMLQIGAVAGLSDAEVPVAKRLDLSKQIAAIAVAKQ